MSKLTKSELKNIRKEVRVYAVKDKHSKGIKFLENLFKEDRYSGNERLRLDMAFLLYHEAIKHLFKKETAGRIKEISKKQIEEAIRICKETLYGKNCSRDKKNIINARMFLAQIYVILNKPRAIYLAKENFREEPCSVTANRLADVYSHLGKTTLAETWYKRYENLALKNDDHSYYVFADMAIFYKKIKKEEIAREYLKKALDNLPKTLEGRSVRLLLKKYFDI